MREKSAIGNGRRPAALLLGKTSARARARAYALCVPLDLTARGAKCSGGGSNVGAAEKEELTVQGARASCSYRREGRRRLGARERESPRCKESISRGAR